MPTARRCGRRGAAGDGQLRGGAATRRAAGGRHGRHDAGRDARRPLRTTTRPPTTVATAAAAVATTVAPCPDPQSPSTPTTRTRDEGGQDRRAGVRRPGDGGSARGDHRSVERTHDAGRRRARRGSAGDPAADARMVRLPHRRHRQGGRRVDRCPPLGSPRPGPLPRRPGGLWPPHVLQAGPVGGPARGEGTSLLRRPSYDGPGRLDRLEVRQGADSPPSRPRWMPRCSTCWRGSAGRLSGDQGKRRIRQSEESAMVGSLARIMLDDSRRRSGPYRIQVRQKGTADHRRPGPARDPRRGGPQRPPAPVRPGADPDPRRRPAGRPHPGGRPDRPDLPATERRRHADPGQGGEGARDPAAVDDPSTADGLARRDRAGRSGCWAGRASST